MGAVCSSSRVAPADPASLALGTAHTSIEKSLRTDWEDQRRVIKCLLLGTGECGKSTILKQMRILHGRGFDGQEEVDMYRMLVLRNTMDSVGALCSAVVALGIQWDDEAQQRMADRVMTFVEAFLHSPSTAAATFEAHCAVATATTAADEAEAIAGIMNADTRAKSTSSSPRNRLLLPPLSANHTTVLLQPSTASPTLPSLSSASTVSSDTSSVDPASSSSSSSSLVNTPSPSPSISPPPPSTAATAAATTIALSDSTSSNGLIPTYIQSAIVALYTCTPIQRALLRQNEFHLLDSAPYFLSNATRILHPHYTPTTADILRSRLPTTGIIESTFRVDKLTFRLYDVGGQRGERKKWMHCFDGVTAIFFIASLSEYDQVLAEDRTRNRMKESLDLFHGITNLPWFRTIPVILFLNKADLFTTKVREVDIGTYFPQYTGGCNMDDGLRYIQDMYLSRNENPDKSVYCHVTDATNTENIAFVWRAAKHIILEQSLHRSGMLF